MVFVESKHVLPKEIPKDGDFVGLNSVVAPDGKEVMHAIILHLYKSNTQIRQKEQLDPYHKVDPTLLWFVNIIDCQRRLILAYSMQVSILTMSYPFDGCDNSIYKYDRNGDISVYNIHDITTRYAICYFDSKDWKSQEILVKYNRLVVQRAYQALEQTPSNEQTIYW